MDTPLRKTMLAHGDVDAISGFTFTSLLSLETKGVKAQDVVVFPYANYGVMLYDNTIIVSSKFLKEIPTAIKAFLMAVAKRVKDVITDLGAATQYVKARDGIVNVEMDISRLKLAIDTVINSLDARADGFDQITAPCLVLMVSQVSDSFNTKSGTIYS